MDFLKSCFKKRAQNNFKNLAPKTKMKLHFLILILGEHHEKAVELLKAAIGSVKLVVRYTPKVLEEMEMRFDKQARPKSSSNFQH